ncbi:hypothetical protein [Spongiactinospora sp. TRM90649]|uniref:hypothetical protein n=1 Tax=Spongiactinospora sp. TRM90649 TaxID=3031114 RepID=UPI0023F7EA76|nr:hypothetical protein [Spongiactinospora sp. TRM90649]MDF5754547.1 hypothetical protein [Spongiactinospora sp. TRM90649]
MDRRLDAVLAELVIRDRLRLRRLRYDRRTGPLLLQVEGAEAALRAWLDDFGKAYSGVLPIGTPDEAGGDPGSRVAVELLNIAYGCGYGGRPAYRLPIVFPRFAAAYTVLVEWQPTVPPRSLAELDSELEGKVTTAIERARRDILPALRRRVGEVVGDPYFGQQHSGLVGLFASVIRAFRFRAFWTLRWYRRKGLRQPVRTTQALIKELRRLRDEPSAPAGGEEAVDARELVLLVDALLADIDAHYGFFRRLNRVRRPVILLPDVHRIPEHRAIRDALLTAFDGRSRNLRVHPVVIATAEPGADGEGARPAVRPGELADEIRAVQARLKTGGEGPGRLLPVSAGPPGPPGSPGSPGGGAAAGRRRTGRAGPVTAALVALAMAAALLTGGAGVARLLRSCGEGLERIDADCVGVSDGTAVFMPGVKGMPEIFKRIEAENDRIAPVPHATVALMIPMQSDVPAVREQILSEMQGAYLAQVRANASADKPPIRLVLANPGREYRLWRTTADRLVEQEPELRVVAGFNLSVDATWHAMHHLTNERRIPVVAGLVTSSDFTNPETQDRARDPFPGLARVVSAAKEQAAALLAFDGGLAGAQTALVADTRPNDNYNSSLRKAFTEARKGRRGTGVQDMTFQSPGIEQAGIAANRFEDFALNICRSKARYIYFAGRGFHLELFVNRLAATYCSGKKSYTVISGSDATTLNSRLDAGERAMLRGDPGGGRPSVSVVYTAPAHPAQWDEEVAKWRRTDEGGAESKPPVYLSEPQEAMARLRAGIAAAELGDVALDDGRTIVTHDVVLTAARALTRAASVSRTEVPSTGHVREVLSDLNAAFRIRGASGWICLTNAGNPYDKPLAVVRLDPAADRLVFEGVAWPEGGPPADECVVPQITP